MIHPERMLVFLVLFMTENIVYGQPDCCNHTNDQHLLFEPVLTGKNFQPHKTIGNQYFKNTWYLGDVFLVNGEVVTNRELAYNGYLDELIWKEVSKLSLVCLDKESITKFILYENNRNQRFVFRHLQGTLENQAGSLDLFAQVIKDDSVEVYATRRIELDEKIEIEVEGVTIRNDKIINSAPVYILELPEHRFLILNKLNRKSFYNLFPEHQAEIKLFLNQHHASLKTENDLLKIIRLLESNKNSVFSHELNQTL
jgi:hypothetical protein